MNRTRSTTGIFDLPEATLTRVIQHALGLTSHGLLRPDAEAQRMAVTLARTSSKLRVATAASIQEVRFPDAEGFWPSASVLAPHAWPSLDTLDCTVNRAGLLGFLKWLVPAAGITRLRVNVVGDPYPASGLALLERKLLGRLFTQVGPGLVELDISGVECQALMFAALFECTSLQKLCIGHYGDATASTLLNLFVLLCLVNRERLELVEFPFTEWQGRMEKVPDGPRLYTACKVTWESLFGSYRAGVKESAVNLPYDESKLVASFKRMSLRTDKLELAMAKSMEAFDDISRSIESSDIPKGLLFSLLPKLKSVNNCSQLR